MRISNWIAGAILAFALQPAMAQREVSSLDAWLRIPSAERFSELGKIAKQHGKLKIQFLDVAPTVDWRYSYSSYRQLGKNAGHCEVYSVYDPETGTSTFVSRSRQVLADPQLVLLLEGFIVGHELGHCVSGVRGYTLPPELAKYQYRDSHSDKLVPAQIRYDEIYADLYGLALLSRRLSREHFYDVVSAVTMYRERRENSVSHNTLPMLTDLDDLAYDQLKGIPLNRIPEIVHKVSVEHIRRNIEKFSQ